MIKKLILNLIFPILVMSLSVFIIANEIDTEYNKQEFYNIINIESAEKEIKANSSTVIYYYQDYCNACSQMKPVLNGVISELNFDVYGVNLGTTELSLYEFTEKHNIKFTPTIVKYVNGDELNRVEGSMSKEDLINFLND